MKPRARIQKPILGFGWAGYAASAVLLALIVPLAVGVDLRYELLKLIRAAFGDEAMMWFVTRLPFLLFAISDSCVSAVTGISLLVALRIVPYHVRAFTQYILFIHCVVWAIVVVGLFRADPVRNIGALVFGEPQFGYGIGGFYLLEVVGTALAAAMILWISRSWIVVIGLVLAITVQLIAIFWSLKSPMMALPETVILFKLFGNAPYSWFTLAFDVSIGGSLLIWAILERRKAFPFRACQCCGYDLAGIATIAVCPECGQKQAAATT